MKIAKSLLYYNLVKELEKRKISNTKLAENIGMSISTFSLKMTGHFDFKLKEMLVIQKYLKEKTGEDFTLDYLFAKE